MRGLGRFTRRLVSQIQKADLLLIASSLTYVTMLAIVPLLAVSFAIFQALGGMKKLYDLVEPLILDNLAEGTGTELVNALHHAVEHTHARAIGLGGMLGLLITSMSLLGHVEKAINRVWQSNTQRHYLKRMLTYSAFVTLGPLALSIAIGVLTSRHMAPVRILPTGVGPWVLEIVVFASIYRFVPNARVKWNAALSGALFTATGMSIARAGYALYTTRVVSYHKIYGSLGAIPIFMLWIYILWVLFLTGVAWSATWNER